MFIFTLNLTQWGTFFVDVTSLLLSALEVGVSYSPCQLAVRVPLNKPNRVANKSGILLAAGGGAALRCRYPETFIFLLEKN